MPHPFRVFDKLDLPVLIGVTELAICGTALGYSAFKFLPMTFPVFSAIYLPYIIIGVAISGILGILPQVYRPIAYEAEKTFAMTKLQVEDETKRVFKQTPLVVHQHKEDYGWHIVYNLPKGLSYKQIFDKKEFLETALKAEIDLQWTGEYLHMDIMTQEVPDYIEYFIDTDRAEQEGAIMEGFSGNAASPDSGRDGRGKDVLPPPGNSEFGEI